MSSRPHSILLALTGAMLLAATACGGAAGNAPAATSSAGTLSAADGLKQAKAVYTAGLSTAATFPAPTAKVSPGKHQIAVVAAGLAAGGAATTAVFVQEAIKAIGYTAPPSYDGKYSPTTQANLIQQAVNSGAEAVILIGITPSTTASAVNLAASKGLPIICILCGPTPANGTSATIINVEPSPDKTGELQAVYTVVHSSGKAKVLAYHDDEYDFTAKQLATAVTSIKKYCPTSCTVSEQQMKTTDLAVAGLPILSSVLTQNPKGSIDYVIAPFDSAAAAFVNLTHQQGRDEIGVVGYAATPNFAAKINGNNPPGAQADITIPLPYMGWASVDLAARALTKAPLWAADQMPVGLLTNENYSQYPADSQYLAPKVDFRATFKALWS